MGKKRRGTRPVPVSVYGPDPLAEQHSDGYPVLSLRFLEQGWGVDDLSDSQRAAFLTKWHKRCRVSWKELVHHDRHGLGSEKIPVGSFRPAVPRVFQDTDRFLVFRHEGNLPMAGVRTGDTYHVIWIERSYGDLYPHQ